MKMKKITILAILFTFMLTSVADEMNAASDCEVG